MPYRPALASSMFAMLAAFGLPASGQSVISTHSGVVHFFEGTVYLDDQPLQFRLGKFPSIPEGGELRSEQGRAEVLLTPGVFLRMGERSAIRLLASDLSDTRVELVEGSAIVDSAQPTPDTSVTLIYKNWTMHSAAPGAYRIDSEPPRIVVHRGETEVFAGGDRVPVSVGPGMELALDGNADGRLAPEHTFENSGDALNTWTDGRNQSISADNAIAANIQDPGSMDNSYLPGDGFTYFPMLGLSSLGPGYSYLNPYQEGFSSIYLPGYTFRPLLILLPGRVPTGRFPRPTVYSPYTPPRTGVTPGTSGVTHVTPGGTRQSPGVTHVTPPPHVAPVTPRPAPASPAPHPMPPVGAHGGRR